MLKPGTIVGKKYCLRHLVAEGGMAEVYLADIVGDEALALPVAIKRLSPKYARDPIIVDMFAHEALLTSSLQHKNIVSCYEFLRDGYDLFIVMENVVGKEIGLILQALKNLDIKERLKFAVAIGLDICDALNYIHNKTDQYGAHEGIVHGDISAQNIMVNVFGEVKLFDFGAAQTGVSGLVFQEKLVRGNLRYMSPEQFRGSQIDARSDVFSLSLVLLEIVSDEPLPTSHKPWSFTESELVNYLSVLKFDLSLSDEITSFFIKGLAQDRDKRFCSSLPMRKHLAQIKSRLFNDNEDCLEYVREFIKSLSLTAVQKPSINIALSFRSLLYLSAITASLGWFVWIVVAFCAEFFDVKHMRNLPYWSAQDNPNLALNEQSQLAIKQAQEPDVVTTKPGKFGTLSLLVKPWAEVFIDGQFFGSTPMAGLNLPEGRYLVQLRNPDMSAVALKMVKIYADKKTELIHNFLGD